jgi:signal-transduction protein with cAMP-binding, CBS, and nucleotidyltransferase domain
MSTPTASNKTLCPGCGEPYILGDDSCSNCNYDLRGLGLPETGGRSEASDFGAPLTEVRIPSHHTLSPTAKVSEAVEILRDDPSGAVVVVERGALVGIFTERDVLSKVASDTSVLDSPMSEVMTPDPVILRDTDTIATALNKMAVGGFRHIPLVHGDQLVGVVTASDLMQWFMQKYID